MPTPISLEHAIVAILNREGEIRGTGFFVTERLIATCAHVVVEARSGPDESLAVFFRQGGETRLAKVLAEYWSARETKGEDVAILELLGEPPPRVEVLPLGSYSEKANQPFVSQGFPALGDYVGITASGTIESRVSKVGGRWMLQLTSPQIEGGFSGAPIWNVTTQRVVGMISEIWTPKATWRNRDTAFATPTETLREICPALQLSDICPYRSLNAFTEEDSEFFFGRDRVVCRLLESLKREQRFLAVMGPSGSGKSSVVQAGLLPELRKGKVPDSEHWEILVVRPAQMTFEGLTPSEKHFFLVIDQFEEILAESEGTHSDHVIRLVELLEKSPQITIMLVMRDDFYGRLSLRVPQLLPWIERNLVNIPGSLERSELSDIIEAPSGKVGLQLEEGLTETILDDVLEVANADKPQRVGRSTILPLLEFALTQVWEQRQDGILTHTAYRVIGGVTGSLTQWADRAYYTLDELMCPTARHIMTSLVHLGDEKRSLPDSRRPRTLSSLLGGGRKPEAIQQVIKHLTSTKYRLLATKQDPQTKEEIVEIIHEALIREWGLLRGWLEEDRRFLLWQQEIEGRVTAWVESETQNMSLRDSGKLLRGGDLVVAEEWLGKRENDLTEFEHAFLSTSLTIREYERAEREASRQRELEQAQKLTTTQRQRALYLTVGFIIAVILSILSFSLYRSSNNNLETANMANTQSVANANTSEARQIEAENARATAEVEVKARATAQSDAEHQRQQAEQQALISRSRELAAQAFMNMQDRYDLSALLSMEALRVKDTDEARSALSNGIMDHLNIRYLGGTSPSATYLAFDYSGKRLASSNCEPIHPSHIGICGTSEIHLWDVSTRQELGTPLSMPGEITRLLFSPDGRWLALVICNRQSATGYACQYEVWILEIATQTLVSRPVLSSERFNISIDFSPDSQILAIASCGHQEHTEVVDLCLQGEVGFWDVEIGQFKYPALVFSGNAELVQFDSSGRYVAVGECAVADDFGTGCFQSRFQVWDVMSSSPLFEAVQPNGQYGLNLIFTNFQIALSACRQSEDYGYCFQPKLYFWDVEESHLNEILDLPERTTQLVFDSLDVLMAVGLNQITAWPFETGVAYSPLILGSEYAGLTLNEESTIAASSQCIGRSPSGDCNQGLIVLFDLGLFGEIYPDLNLGEEIASLEDSACEIVGRNLTQLEWELYFLNEPYHRTCPQWPPGESLTP